MKESKEQEGKEYVNNCPFTFFEYLAFSQKTLTCEGFHHLNYIAVNGIPPTESHALSTFDKKKD